MDGQTYTIGDPVDAVPEVVTIKQRDDWSHAYRAAERAAGLWVPVTMPDSTRARNLAAVAKRRRGMEAEARKNVAYLRVIR